VPRFRLPRSRSRSRDTSPLLLLGVGAIVGVAVGALLGDRVAAAIRSGRRRPPVDPWAHVAHGTFDDEEIGDQGDDEAPPTAPPRVPTPSVERRVLEAFRHDPVLAERAIDIDESPAGVIRLTGWVRAEREIGHARTIAGGVPGVRRVETDLAVRAPRRPWTVRGTAPAPADAAGRDG
jgi:hypothetical protein